jgi:serine/threonine protein kinase
LGRGDFGVVYLARDRWAPKGAEQVAIKEMPMQMIVDCERQADLRAILLHPAIPRICGYFVTGEHSYLVQEFICGSDLEAVLEAHEGFLPEKRVSRWAIQLCEALDYLHNHPFQPIIFRDLKPNNIMVDQKDRIHLVDFGLARAFPARFFQETQPQFSHFHKGLAMGTAGYSPPEQYRGRVTPQSDIYALGATLHHLLTRRDPRQVRPFTFQQYPLRSLNPALSPELEAIIMKSLNQDPAQRFDSAKQMQLALEAID